MGIEDFSENMKVEMVSAEEFRKRIGERRPDQSAANIERGRGYQYVDDSGQVRILIKKDGIPDEFLPYIEEHEMWEAYVANKKGFNLVSKARRNVREKLREVMPQISDRNVDQIFNQFINEYNFDYKHEFAIWKEYQRAEQDGNLDRYHEFIISLREADLVKFSDDPAVVRQTQNDLSFRKSIYEKIRSGGKHHFSQNVPKRSGQ